MSPSNGDEWVAPYAPGGNQSIRAPLADITIDCNLCFPVAANFLLIYKGCELLWIAASSARVLIRVAGLVATHVAKIRFLSLATERTRVSGGPVAKERTAVRIRHAVSAKTKR